MTARRAKVAGSPTKKTRQRQSDVTARGDFQWPPADDDPDSCSIVLFETEAGLDARPRPLMLADGPMEAFPDIDLDTALDAFADQPATASVPPVMTSASAQRRYPSPTAQWHGVALRSVVALCIGASLALMPPPGLTRVVDAQRLDDPAPRPEPRGVTPRAVTTPERVTVGHRPTVEPQPEPPSGPVDPKDEDHIRTVLADLRGAYAQLDVNAAREVWPSVDVEALGRAFEGLKSQQLRFDHCNVTVEVARARAACTGDAVYVPKVGEPSGSYPRAWAFELARDRSRWLIVWARAT